MSERPAEALSFSTRDVADALGLSYRALLFWIAQGYVSTLPRHDTAGTGFPIRLSYANVLQVAVMQALVDAGVYPSMAAKMLVDDYHDGIISISVDLRAVERKLESSSLGRTPNHNGVPT